MKKLILILIMTATAATTLAQSQLSTVRGKTKDGKTIEVKYYKGAVEDYVESVKYQVIDDLQSQVKSLQADAKSIQGKLDAANKRIKELENKAGKNSNSEELRNLREKAAENEAQITLLNDSIAILQTQLDSVSMQSNKELQALRDEIAIKDQTILQLNKQLTAVNTGVATPVIGLETGWGIVFPGSINDNWERDYSTGLQAAVYFGTGRLSKSFPISVEAGVGFRKISLVAHSNSFEKKIEDATDKDGDHYEAIYTFQNLSESLTLKYFDIPIRLCFGQPYKSKASLYAKLGITPSINIGTSKIVGTGSYDLKGYYPEWDVTLENIEELGFVNDGDYKDIEIKTEPNKFNLWGNVVLGAYVPLSKNIPLVLNAGLKFDYPIMQMGKAYYKDSQALPEYTGLLQNGGRTFIPSFGIGLVYTLR
jgi:predicted  nucleic acid-binding Zn-ribbon protein